MAAVDTQAPRPMLDLEDEDPAQSADDDDMYSSASGPEDDSEQLQGSSKGTPNGKVVPASKYSRPIPWSEAEDKKLIAFVEKHRPLHPKLPWTSFFRDVYGTLPKGEGLPGRPHHLVHRRFCHQRTGLETKTYLDEYEERRKKAAKVAAPRVTIAHEAAPVLPKPTAPAPVPKPAAADERKRPTEEEKGGGKRAKGEEEGDRRGASVGSAQGKGDHPMPCPVPPSAPAPAPQAAARAPPAPAPAPPAPALTPSAAAQPAPASAFTSIDTNVPPSATSLWVAAGAVGFAFPDPGAPLAPPGALLLSVPIGARRVRVAPSPPSVVVDFQF